LYAFELSLGISLTSIAELVQATKAYYLTVEGFITSDPLLLNLRCMAGYIMRELDMYDIGDVTDWKNVDACVDNLMNGH